MEMTGAKILMECLLEQGVDTVFGYPGGTILNVYDALYFYRDRINHILVSHEQGASHAADGYARSTGKVGVCFATSGPGATNLVTGIATAYMDSSPVVFITCNVNQNLIGKDAFQEVDITGIAMPITKSTYLVRDAADIADTVREAFALARSGRPGPVLIDIVKNATAEKAEYEYLPREKHISSGRLASLIRRARTSSLKMPEPNQDDVNILVDMIAQSKKPMLICGGGVVRGRAHREFREFAHRIDAPVAITLMGGGGISGTDELATGMIGMHGSKASNMACDGCDLLIAVGCRFSDRVALKPATFARQAKLVHIDIDRAEIDKNVQTDHHIIGNAKQVLELLNRKVPQYNHSEWKKYVFSFPTETEYDENEYVLTPKQILSTISRMSPVDTIVATDVGQHQMWAIQHFHFDYPGQLLTSGARQACHPHHRRRLLPHELQRAGHRGILQAPHPDLRLQQPPAGHGPPVAGADLRQALLHDHHRPGPRLREAGGGLRPQGRAGPHRGGAGGRHPGGHGGGQAGPRLHRGLHHPGG